MRKRVLNVKFALLFIVSGAPWTYVSSADTYRPFEAKIVDYGIYTLTAKKVSIPSDTDTAGYTSYVQKKTDVVLETQTTQIPTKKGTVFGFRFDILSWPDGWHDKITLKYEHPEIVRPDGKKSTGFEIRKRTRERKAPPDDGIVYSLSEDFELVPGKWTLSVLYKDEPVLTKTFTLVAP